jgi:hypothetical protein
MTDRTLDIPSADARRTAIETPLDRLRRVAAFLWRGLAALHSTVAPSRSPRANVAKIALAGSGVAILFLFAVPFWLPGGGSQFVFYADAIAHGTTLPPQFAQRDIGYPLLILLSGYMITGSLLPLAVMQAGFAVLMPIFIYVAIDRFSRPVAYTAALFAICSLAPVYFMKMIHHDQAYIFLMMLMISILAVYLHTKSIRYLYYFTAAAIAASVTRPAGNLLFPLFLAIAYFSVRGRFVHYAACAVITIGALGLYQWHRYEIFNMRAQPSMPSYTGKQIFYGLYINSAEFGVHLTPQLGPNMHAIADALYNSLQPSPKESVLVRQTYSEGPAAQFAQHYIDTFTADELLRQVFAVPSYEYNNLMDESEPNDRVFLKASWEIFSNYPLYVMRYTLRNMAVFLLTPGYKHSRYNIDPFGHEGLIFPPDYGRLVGNNETDGLEPRAVRELLFDPLSLAPRFVQLVYQRIESYWLAHYVHMIHITSVLMLLAWSGVVAAIARVWLPIPVPPPLTDVVIGRAFSSSIVAATMLLLYNAAVTAAFAEPDYRYHHMIMLLRILIAGYGGVVLVGLLAACRDRAAAVLRNNTDVAIVLSRMRSIGSDGKRNATLIAAVIVILVFGGVGIYRYRLSFAEFVYREPSYRRASLPRLRAGETLEFGNGRNESALLSGWSAREPGGVWSDGNAAYLGFLVHGGSNSASNAPGKLTVRATAFVVPGKLPNRRLEVRSNGTKIGTYTLERHAEFTVSLDRVAVKDGLPLTVALYLPDTRSPLKTNNTPDPRQLAIFLQSVQAIP